MRKLKTAWMVVALALLAVAGGIRPARADDAEMMRRAIDKAVARISTELDATEFSIKSIAVVPLRGDTDGGYVTDQIRSAVTSSPYAAFTRDDETWDTLLAEIGWGDKRGDVMDAATIQKFGSINGVETILYGVVWDKSFSDSGARAHTRIGVRLAVVETGQEIWAATVEGEDRITVPDFLERYRLHILTGVGVVIGVIILLVILRRIRKAIAHSTRPL